MKPNAWMQGFDPGLFNKKVTFFSIGVNETSGFGEETRTELQTVWGHVMQVKGEEKEIDTERNLIVQKVTVRYKQEYMTTSNEIRIDGQDYQINSAKFDNNNYLIELIATRKL